MESKKRIVIADDHLLFLNTLESYLAMKLPDIEVYTCSSHDDLVQLLDTSPHIDIAIVDLYMPGSDGEKTIEDLINRYPASNFAVISGLISKQQISKCIGVGVAGILLKDMSAEDTVSAIQRILRGGLYLPKNLMELHGGSITMAYSGVKLTQREVEVLHYLHEGCSNKLIARHLDIAEVTIKMHFRQLFKKYNVKNRIELALKSHQDIVYRS